VDEPPSGGGKGGVGYLVEEALRRDVEWTDG
jgi:hypothetical protein